MFCVHVLLLPRAQNASECKPTDSGIFGRRAATPSRDVWCRSLRLGQASPAAAAAGASQAAANSGERAGLPGRKRCGRKSWTAKLFPGSISTDYFPISCQLAGCLTQKAFLHRGKKTKQSTKQRNTHTPSTATPGPGHCPATEPSARALRALPGTTQGARQRGSSRRLSSLPQPHELSGTGQNFLIAHA